MQREETKAKKDWAIRSLQEVADMLGMSRQRVHQIEQEAFAKIRRALLWDESSGQSSVSGILSDEAEAKWKAAELGNLMKILRRENRREVRSLEKRERLL